MTKFKNKYIGDKKFYKIVLALAIPIIIQNGITNLVNMIDNIMVGQVGTNQMTGVAIINHDKCVGCGRCIGMCNFDAIKPNNSSANDILNKKPGALENYMKFLSSGGSDYPLEILKKCGVDMTDISVLESAFTLFEERLNELKELTEVKKRCLK